ncbi:hypothetical protein LUZ60_002817 [Juncus effusus]|nr:hypothetical protein LUZ60_002817 [Juncus effusus]
MFGEGMNEGINVKYSDGSTGQLLPATALSFPLTALAGKTSPPLLPSFSRNLLPRRLLFSSPTLYKMRVLRSTSKLANKTLDSSSPPRPMSEPPPPDPDSSPSLRRSRRFSSSSTLNLNPSSGPSGSRNGSKRKSESGVDEQDGSTDGSRSVSRRKIFTRSRSKEVKIEGLDLNLMPGEGEVPTNLETSGTEERIGRVLRSGSAISKRKIRDDEIDLDKIEGNDEIGDNLAGKRRLDETKETQSTNLVEEIRENVNLTAGVTFTTVNLEKIDFKHSQMADQKKEESRGISNKDKGKGKLVIIDDESCEVSNKDKGKGKLVIIDDDSCEVNNKDKGKGKLVMIDEESCEIPQNNLRSNRTFTYDEKGKGKMVIEEISDSDSLCDSDSEDELLTVKGEIPDFSHIEKAIKMYQQMAEKKPVSRREADRNKALELAPKFAFFKDSEGDESGTDEDSVPDSGTDDWPGPFSTAMKIIKEREAKLEARQNNSSKIDESNEVKIPWVPSRDKNKKQGSFCKTAPSLKSLAMRVLVENADEIESLEGIPDGMKSRIVRMLCDSRKMSFRVLCQLAKDRPAEICVSDCSWVTEKEFQEVFGDCDTSDLKVLKLDLCGRCLPDPILHSTLARSPNSLPALTTLSLKGAYSLSDAGLSSLASSAPALSSLNLSHCSFLTSLGIITLLGKLGGRLREVCVDECQGVNAMDVLPSLRKVGGLEVLGMAGVVGVSDRFVRELVGVCGGSLKKLSFAGCVKLTSSAIKVIGENCPNLLELDIRNVTRLNDSAIAHLANGCGSIQKLFLRRNSFSDEAVAAFVEASGANLVELSLNNVQKVGHHTALAIYRKCRVLQNLDLSFCRKMSDEALGLIVDTCLSLRIVKLFGCTQIKGHFLDGHSNSSVKVLGLTGNILDQFEVPDFV